MDPQQIAARPIHVGIFNTVAEADRAVHRLLDAGFTKDQIGVLCSERYKDQFFPDLHKATPPGAPPGAIAAGGAIGATIGGLALAASAIMTGGATLLAAGTVLVGGGAIAGSFAGAMATMGYDRKAADQYERAVQQGKILVAVEATGEGSAERLEEAERLMDEAGAERLLAVRS